MAALLSWPSKYYFYPIGSHAALHLTRDLPPDKSACVLLLPCGDPRNIMHTVFLETSSIRPALDFTCCDFDAGVLSRNVLLLSMIADNIPSNVIWGVYLDMRLDDETFAIFTAQCRKLIEYSGTADAWRASPYASTLRMGSDSTLDELHRHWSLYLASSVTTADERALDNGRAAIHRKYHHNALGVTTLSTGRSAGPLFRDSSTYYTQQLHRYWETGVTSSKLPASSHANPTFLYSRAGKCFAVHHGIDPLAPFHLSHVFGNEHNTITVDHLVAAAREEFDQWCTSYHIWLSAPHRTLTIRFLLGDVLAIARALESWNNGAETFSVSPSPAQWSSQKLQLSADEYHASRAPTRFDAIDTSNISDSIGMLNVLLASTPLLAHSPSSGVLYTESFLSDNSHPSKQLETILVADLAIHSLLLGVAPIGALSGFTTQCDTHELLLRTTRFGPLRAPGADLHHQMLTWKRPWTADTASGAPSPPLIDLAPAQLSSIIYHIYDFLFEGEKPHSPSAALASTMRAGHYTRETFIILLLSMRTRLAHSNAQWSETVSLFLEQLGQRSRSGSFLQHNFDACSALELHTLLYQYHLYPDLSRYGSLCAPTGRISRWTTIPSLVRIYLTIPAEKLTRLRDHRIELSDLPLRCALTCSGYEHYFHTLHAVFGWVRDVGSPAEPAIVIEETTGGVSGAETSPLILSFVVPTGTVVKKASVESKPLTVRAAVKATRSTMALLQPLWGEDFTIFSARFEDAQHVHVVPAERIPLPPRPPTQLPLSPERAITIGEQCLVRVDLEGGGASGVVLTARLQVEDAQAKAAFSGGAMPSITQGSSCTMLVILSSRSQCVTYPVPIEGSGRKVRLARRSSYIEIVVHAAVPSLGHADGMKLNPFPVVHAQRDLSSWNMHRVNLDQLPLLDITAARLSHWFNTHISSQFSERESQMKRREIAPDTLTLVKDTIHYLMSKSVGLGDVHSQGVFALRDNATNDSDTIFFIRGLRYDLSSHTVVCDAFVLPLFPELMASIKPAFSRLLRAGAGLEGITNTRTFDGETRAWKQILPALVERCRTTWSHRPQCEYLTKGRVPLSEEIHGGDPLCSCGRGKDVQGMKDVELWRPFASRVTRIALSPLFAVSYVEQVLPPIATVRSADELLRASATSDTGPVGASSSHTQEQNPLDMQQCKTCAKSGRGLKRCCGCSKVLYCSVSCQKANWEEHKLVCGGRGR
ncbi:hypothetical protein BC628DRAFT_1326016 [Trametes gibbosa]|nr:hypothetical protein BC628DRAFT_1326016 [Trametes gibbosa]